MLLIFYLNTSILVGAVIHWPHRASRTVHRRGVEILPSSEMDVALIVANAEAAAVDCDYVAAVAET